MINFKVSIIIPIYNVSPYIERCLYSVSNQTYSNIECLLINDCTPDDSMDKTMAYIEKDQSNIEFKIINHDENKGLSAARNSGIKNATGKYLYFLDSDDVILNDSISKMVVYAEENNVDIVITNYNEISLNDDLLANKPYNLTNNLLDTNLSVIQAFCNREFFVMAWNKLVLRQFVINNDLYFQEGIFHEDELWTFSLALCANNCVIVDEPLYHYRIRPNSITKEVTSFHIDSLVNVLKLMVHFSINIKEPDSLEKHSMLFKYVEDFKMMIWAKCVSSNKTFFSTYRFLRNLKLDHPEECAVNLRTVHYKFPLLIGGIYMWTYLKISHIYHTIR